LRRYRSGRPEPHWGVLPNRIAAAQDPTDRFRSAHSRRWGRRGSPRTAWHRYRGRYLLASHALGATTCPALCGWTWKGPRRPVDNDGRTRCRRDVHRSEGCLGLFLAQPRDRL